MNENDAAIFDQLQPIFSTLLQVDSHKIMPGSSMENLPQWDSLRHLALIVRIEKEFGVSFSGGEAASMTSIRAVIEKIKSCRNP